MSFNKIVFAILILSLFFLEVAAARDGKSYVAAGAVWKDLCGFIAKTAVRGAMKAAGKTPEKHFEDFMNWLGLQDDAPGTFKLNDETVGYYVATAIYMLSMSGWNVAHWPEVGKAIKTAAGGAYPAMDLVLWLVEQGRLTWPKGQGMKHGDLKKKEGPFNVRALTFTNPAMQLWVWVESRETCPTALELCNRPQIACIDADDALKIQIHAQQELFRKNVLKQTEYKKEWTEMRFKTAARLVVVDSTNGNVKDWNSGGGMTTSKYSYDDLAAYVKLVWKPSV